MLITHEMEVVRTVCDRVAVIDGGRIVETGAVADIFAGASHPATQRLLAALAA
jgi:D-methionine transport system ATP-binding protein